MKRSAFNLLFMLISFSLLFGINDLEAKAPIKLKAVSFLFKDDPANQNLMMFVDRVNERAKGKLSIEWIGGPEVVNEFDLANSVAIGVIDIGFITSAFVTGNVPGAEFYCTSKLSASQLRKNGFFDYFKEMHNKGSLHLIGNADEFVDFWYIFLNKPANKLSDLKGMKLGDGTVLLKFLKEVGASSVTIGAPDAYTALERGVIDGILWPRRLIAALKLQETLKYYIDVPFFRNDLTFIMNLEQWNSLTDELKQILEEVALSVEKDSMALSQQIETKATEDIAAAGVKKIDFEPAEANKLIELIYSTEWDTLVKRYPDFGPQMVELLSEPAE